MTLIYVQLNSLVSSADEKCMMYCVGAPYNVVKLLLESSYSTLVSDIAVCLPLVRDCAHIVGGSS